MTEWPFSVFCIAPLQLSFADGGRMSDATAASLIQREPQPQGIPWLVWANVIASIAIATGLYWDISWHETIGRDSFWTAAHLLIQFGAILGAFGSAWIIMRTTFGGDTEARAGAGHGPGLCGAVGAVLSPP